MADLTIFCVVDFNVAVPWAKQMSHFSLSLVAVTAKCCSFDVKVQGVGISSSAIAEIFAFAAEITFILAIGVFDSLEYRLLHHYRHTIRHG